MDLGSGSKGEIGTQVLSCSLRFGGSLGSDGGMTHVKTAESSEALVTGGGLWGVQSCCQAKHIVFSACPSLHGEPGLLGEFLEQGLSA